MMQRLECLRAVYDQMKDCLRSYSRWDTGRISFTCNMRWASPRLPGLALPCVFPARRSLSWMAMDPFS